MVRLIRIRSLVSAFSRRSDPKLTAGRGRLHSIISTGRTRGSVRFDLGAEDPADAEHRGQDDPEKGGGEDLSPLLAADVVVVESALCLVEVEPVAWFLERGDGAEQDAGQVRQ